ncbi:tryptophan 7-halogenase [Qipengyuania sp. DSG2-2]|uniref:tryptophan 7-halogenase n=1 Tax=Qipengyuania sp. DGS2-2 TaxID=3349631 RepID=UPI0036D43883
MSRPVETIVVTGRTVDVWPVAALLARELPGAIALHVVEDMASDGALAATVPIASDFHSRLGLDCADLITGCDAWPSLGSAMEGWMGEGSRFVTAPSGTLPMVGGVALHHLVRNMIAGQRQDGDLANAFAPLRFAARAAEAGKMALPSDAPESPLAMLGPQVSVGRGAYAAMLRDRCRQRGTITAGKVQGAQRDDDGSVTAVKLADGSLLSGDFFVDCSGDLGGSEGQISELVPFLPHRMATAEMAKDQAQTLPTYRALEDAVLASTPTASKQFLAFACSAQTSDEVIAKTVCENAAITDAANHATNAPWQDNVARLGPASAQLGPMLSADIALLQAQALLLADGLPSRTDMQAEAKAFNRKHAEALRGITDFAFAPLYLCTRKGEFWEAMRAAPPPANLQTRIDQFSSRGRVPSFERDHADQQTWIELLIQFGITPQQIDRRAQAIPPEQASRILSSIRADLERALTGMTDQDAYFRRMR